jgi:uncharacterized protein YbjT (DUF2867 family)
MRILVLGAGGFIGGRIAAHLRARGHAILPCGRNLVALRRRFPGVEPCVVDLATADAAAWQRRLNGVDAVINAAGALAGDLDAVHATGPVALFEACAAMNIGRVVQVSALGAEDGSSRFHRSKRVADEHLLRLREAGGRDGWCVLRPSLVIGRGGHSTGLFAALAALPRPVRLGRGNWRVQPLHVADLARCVADVLKAPGPLPPCLNLVGPEPMDTDHLTAMLRGWLGLPECQPLALPEPVLRLAARIGRWLPGASLTPETLAMLAHGSTAEEGPATAFLGWQPQSLAPALAAEPAVAADLWHARLLPVRPLLRAALALVWIGSGVVSLTLAPRAVSDVLLAGLGLHGAAATLVLVAGAILDLLLGLALVLLPRRTGWVGAAQIAVTLLFTLLASIAAPAAWAEPFGPLLKNAAVIAATVALMAMRD